MISDGVVQQRIRVKRARKHIIEMNFNDPKPTSARKAIRRDVEMRAAFGIEGIEYGRYFEGRQLMLFWLATWPPPSPT